MAPRRRNSASLSSPPPPSASLTPSASSSSPSPPAAALLLALATLAAASAPPAAPAPPPPAALAAQLPTNPFCAFRYEVNVVRVNLACVNGVIDAVSAFFGTPTGACPSFAADPRCDLASFGAYAQAACLGQRNCSLVSRVDEDPCLGTEKAIAAVAHCSEAPGGYSPPASPAVGAGYYMLQPIINGSVQPVGLRHCTGIASFDRNPAGGDFEWKLTEAADDDRAGVSLQPNNYFFDSLGWLQSPPVDSHAATNVTLGIVSPSGIGGFRVPLADMSWWLVDGLDGSGLGFSLTTLSRNSAVAGYALSVTDCVKCPFCGPGESYHVGDAVLAPPGALTAGNGTVLTQTFSFVRVADAALGAGAPWATEHANAQNSGNNQGDGPGETYSTCRQQMLKTDPLAAGAPRFLSSGVTSIQDSWWLGGSSEDSLWLLEDLAVARQDDAAWQTFRLNLTAVLNVSDGGPATPYGIVGAPAATADVAGASYSIYVASGNGFVAALDMLRCFSGATPAFRGAHAAAGYAVAEAEAAGAAAMPAGAAWLGAFSAPATSAARGARAAAGANSLAHTAASSAGWVPGAHATAARAATAAATNAGQWVSYSNVNAVQNQWPPSYPFFINGTTQTWPECQALCWANNTASGGEPNGCVVWTWHDEKNLEYSYQCWFKMTSGFEAHYQADHVTGFLSTGTAGPDCVTWSRPISTAASSPGGALRPSYSSARLASAGGAILLVSETDAELDTGGVLHGISAANGSELFYYPAMSVGGASVGLKGLVPATLAQAPGIAVLAFGTRVVAIDVSACAGAGPAAGPCKEIAAYDNSAEGPGGGDAFVSSPVLRADGTAVYLHSSTGTLRKLSIALDGGGRPTGFALQWACRFSRAANASCTPPSAATARRRPGGHSRGAWGGELEEVPTADFGVAGGWYQPTTRAERDELHAEIRALHLRRFGAARGAPANAAERADAVQHAARLARELPRAELLAIVTPSGYRRLGPSGLPAPTGRVEDFGGLYPFATPSLWWDGSRLATVDFRLDTDSGLFIVGEGNGVPVDMGDGTSFAVFDLTLANGEVVPFGRSRSSPALDRQGHIYVGADTDYSGNPLDNDTYPILLCVAVSKAVKWASSCAPARQRAMPVRAPACARAPARARARAHACAHAHANTRARACACARARKHACALARKLAHADALRLEPSPAGDRPWRGACCERGLGEPGARRRPLPGPTGHLHGEQRRRHDRAGGAAWPLVPDRRRAAGLQRPRRLRLRHGAVRLQGLLAGRRPAAELRDLQPGALRGRRTRDVHGWGRLRLLRQVRHGRALRRRA